MLFSAARPPSRTWEHTVGLMGIRLPFPHRRARTFRGSSNPPIGRYRCQVGGGNAHGHTNARTRRRVTCAMSHEHAQLPEAATSDSGGHSPDDFLIALRPHVEVRVAPAGTILFAEGAPGDCAYVVSSGSVLIAKEQLSSTAALAHRGPGDIIGEMALIDESPRFASAVCETVCELLVLSRARFFGILTSRPDIAAGVLKMMTARIREADVKRLRETEAVNEDLRSARARLEAALIHRDRIISVSPYPIIVTDSQNRINLYNPEAEVLLGHATQADLWKCVVPCDTAVPAQAEAMLQSGTTWRAEIEVAGLHHRGLLCKVTAVPIPDSGNGKTSRLWVFEDVTEMRTLQKQAVEQYGLAMKGEMAGEIAHELNNYLAVLSGNAELLPVRLKKNDPTLVDRTLENINQAIVQMTVFTDGLLRSRHPQGQRATIDLNEFVANQIVFLRPQKRFKKLVITTDLQSGLPPLECDPSGLQQVIYNLILNASDALIGAAIPNPTVFITTRHDPDHGEVCLIVGDNGPGIPPEIKPRLFMERVTSKPTGHGFGTLTILRIVQEHRGQITAGQRAGGGAEFVITLPASAIPLTTE